MRKPTSPPPRVLRAVGYVRVSTDQQAQEGVSLEAQHVRIRAHCVSQQIQLVDICADEGYSAKSLERPGIKRALDMLRTGKADAIVVVKLDRLTRSVKDLGYLCDSFFREGLPYSLLSVSDSIDTRSAGGKLLLNVLMSVAQWEREAISERTQEAMNELKRQGVHIGGAVRLLQRAGLRGDGHTDPGRLAVRLGHRRCRLSDPRRCRLRCLPGGRRDFGLLTYLHRVPLGHVTRAIVR